MVALKRAGADLILLGFLHFQEEVDYFGKHVIPLIRELEGAEAQPRGCRGIAEHLAGQESRAATRGVGFRLKKVKQRVTVPDRGGHAKETPCASFSGWREAGKKGVKKP